MMLVWRVGVICLDEIFSRGELFYFFYDSSCIEVKALLLAIPFSKAQNELYSGASTTK